MRPNNTGMDQLSSTACPNKADNTEYTKLVGATAQENAHRTTSANYYTAASDSAASVARVNLGTPPHGILDIRKKAFRNDLASKETQISAWESEFHNNMVPLAHSILNQTISVQELYIALANRRKAYADVQKQNGRYGQLRKSEMLQWTYEPFWMNSLALDIQSAPRWGQSTLESIQAMRSEKAVVRRSFKITPNFILSMPRFVDNEMSGQDQHDFKVVYTQTKYMPSCPQPSQFYALFDTVDEAKIAEHITSIINTPWDKDSIKLLDKLHDTKTSLGITLQPVHLTRADLSDLSLPSGTVLPMILSCHCFFETEENEIIADIFLYANATIDSKDQRDELLFLITNQLITKILSHSIVKEENLDMVKIDMARLMYMLAHMLPIYRGNASIIETIISGISKKLGIEGKLHYSPEDDGWDVMTFKMTMQQYISWFKSRCRCELQETQQRTLIASSSDLASGVAQKGCWPTIFHHERSSNCVDLSDAAAQNFYTHQKNYS